MIAISGLLAQYSNLTVTGPECGRRIQLLTFTTCRLLLQRLLNTEMNWPPLSGVFKWSGALKGGARS